MTPLKNILKFHVLPKKLYLHYSAQNKHRRICSNAESKESELQLLPLLIDRRKNSVDVGANTGLYTYFLSRWSAHVYAFEPHKILADFLKRATAGNVTIINKAVSDKDGEQMLYTPVIDGKKFLNIASFNEEMAHYLSDIASSTKGVPSQRQYVKERLETVTLDALELKDIGFIKIDVEGHELAVLNGAVKTIKTHRPVMLIEVLGSAKDRPQSDIVKFMRAQNYEVFTLEDRILQFVTDKSSARTRKNFIFLPK